MRRNCRKFGTVIVLTGLGVLVILILPSGFWLFAIGIILILIGLCIMRR